MLRLKQSRNTQLFNFYSAVQNFKRPLKMLVDDITLPLDIHVIVYHIICEASAENDKSYWKSMVYKQNQ